MISHHSNIFNPPPPIYFSVFRMALTTHTHAHIPSVCKVHTHTLTCKQLQFHWQVHSLFSSSHFPLLLLLPGADQRQPQALWKHWKDPSDESLIDSIESYETEGTQDGRRRDLERGRYFHAGTHRCPCVSERFSATASSTLKELWKEKIVSVKGVISVCFIHSDIWCHWCLPCCIYEPTVSNRLHPIDYYGGLGARGNAIKD